MRYGTDVANAIREAHARGARPSDVLKKLRAGTLPEIEGPVDIKDRTFWNYWSKAKREQEAARHQTDDAPPNGPTLFDRIGVEMLFRDGLNPDAIAEQLGLEKSFVRTCIERSAEYRAEQARRDLAARERVEQARRSRDEYRRQQGLAPDEVAS